MKQLITMRHAKSDWHQGLTDFERPLNKRGRADAPHMGAWLAAQDLLPDGVLCSPAQRTKDTYEGVVSALNTPLPIASDHTLYHASAKMMLTFARNSAALLSKDCDRLLMIGHNPGVHEFCLGLIEVTHHAETYEVLDKYPTGAIAVIECNITQWADLDWACGHLQTFVTPKTI